MGADLNQFVLATDPTDADLARRAAVNVAGGLAFHHPHELDNEDPKAAGRELAKNPELADDLRELLDAVGYEAPQLSPWAALVDACRRYYIRLASAYIAARETELAAAKALNKILKGDR